MKHKSWKKLAVSILSLLMIFSMMPLDTGATASAEGDRYEPTGEYVKVSVDSGENVISVNEWASQKLEIQSEGTIQMSPGEERESTVTVRNLTDTPKSFI